MKTPVLLGLSILLWSFHVEGQLYVSSNAWYSYFAEVRRDSAHIEVFQKSPPDFVNILFDKVIPVNNIPSDSSLAGNKAEILITSKGYTLRTILQTRKPETILLKLCEYDNRKELRNRSYYTEKLMKIYRLQDSLSGPDSKIPLDQPSNSFRNINTSLPEKEHEDLCDKIFDSVSNKIYGLRSSIADYYYRQIDSFSALDTAKIFDLLSHADYSFHYGKYLLFKLAEERPGILISYIDSDPLNKNTVLRAIRNHDSFKEITKKVKETDFSSPGKKKIVMQRSNRIMKDIGVGAVNISLFLIELAIIPVIVLLIVH